MAVRTGELSRTLTEASVKRPSIERVYSVVYSTVKRAKLSARWSSIGKLIDALSEERDSDDVLAWLCELMNKNDRVTRSALLGPAMDYLGLPAIRSIAEQAHEAWKYKANGHAVKITHDEHKANGHARTAKRRSSSRARERVTEPEQRRDRPSIR